MAEGTTCSKFVKLVPTMKHPPECTCMHDAALRYSINKKSGRFVSPTVYREMTGARHVYVPERIRVSHRVALADIAFL